MKRGKYITALILFAAATVLLALFNLDGFPQALPNTYKLVISNPAKVDFQELSDEVSHMVQMAMMAYDKKNLDLADEVIKYDDVVDKLFCDIRGDLIKQLKDDTNDAECFIDMLMIDKYFERIGDHAVNIASWVKFSITGEIQIVE